eukprot:1787392-Rhodomonas_salina.3
MSATTPRNPVQETAISAQFVPESWFLVLDDFGVYLTIGCAGTRWICDASLVLRWAMLLPDAAPHERRHPGSTLPIVLRTPYAMSGTVTACCYEPLSGA